MDEQQAKFVAQDFINGFRQFFQNTSDPVFMEAVANELKAEQTVYQAQMEKYTDIVTKAKANSDAIIAMTQLFITPEE